MVGAVRGQGHRAGAFENLVKRSEPQHGAGSESDREDDPVSLRARHFGHLLIRAARPEISSALREKPLPRVSANAIAWISAAVVALLAAAVVHDHARLDSASMDEPVHIHAAYLQVFRHSSLVNIEHPPLAKDAAGLGLALLKTPPEATAVSGPDFAGAGHDFLFRNRVPADRILAAARAPMLLFFVALLLLVFGAARRYFGTAAGFVALVLVAFEPNFLAHSGIVHTDVPVTLFWLAFVLSWSRLLERRTAGRVAVAALLLGGALATKFSAVYLVPTGVLVALGVRIAERRETASSGIASRFLRDMMILALVGLLALPVVVAIYQPSVSGMGIREQQAVLDSYLRGAGRSPRIAALIGRIALHSRALAHYLGGLTSVAVQSTSGANVNFLNGRVSLAGFPSYFFVAFFVKTGPALLFAVVIAAGFALGRPKERCDAILWLPPAYYFLFSIGSSYNIGVRHILPVYPFLAIAAARPIADLASRAKPLAILLGVGLCGFQIATAVRAHPYELSYFNVFGGGMRKGYRVLADSNVDWGLDLRRLAQELSRRNARDAEVFYFGGDDPSYRIVPRDFPPNAASEPHLVAISASLWDFGAPYYAVHGRPDLAKRISNLVDRLSRGGRPAGRIGGSTFLFELDPEKTP